MTKVNFRHAQREDCEQLLELMKQLAIFEDYADQFSVTLDDLIDQGFSSETSNFTAIVAEQGDQLLGYLVYYLIPFTYDLKPTLFIKELYVARKARCKGVGKGIMNLTIEDARVKKCGRMKWDVLSDNTKAQIFYQNFGATHDKKWQGYVLKL